MSEIRISSNHRELHGAIFHRAFVSFLRRNRAYIRSAKIVVPKTWSPILNAVSEQVRDAPPFHSAANQEPPVGPSGCHSKWSPVPAIGPSNLAKYPMSLPNRVVLSGLPIQNLLGPSNGQLPTHCLAKLFLDTTGSLRIQKSRNTHA